MTKREIAKLCCQVLAIYALIQALPGIAELFKLSLPFIDDVRWSTAEIVTQILNVFYFLAFLCIAAFLWRWSGLVASWIAGYDIQDNVNEPEAISVPAKIHELHAIAFSVVGVWVLADAVPRLIGYVTQLVYTQSISGSGIVSHGRIFIASTASELLLRILLGLWLLFGASGLVQLIRKVRNFGLEDEEKAAPQK